MPGMPNQLLELLQGSRPFLLNSQCLLGCSCSDLWERPLSQPLIWQMKEAELEAAEPTPRDGAFGKKIYLALILNLTILEPHADPMPCPCHDTLLGLFGKDTTMLAFSVGSAIVLLPQVSANHSAARGHTCHNSNLVFGCSLSKDYLDLQAHRISRRTCSATFALPLLYRVPQGSRPVAAGEAWLPQDLPSCPLPHPLGRSETFLPLAFLLSHFRAARCRSSCPWNESGWT